MSAVSFVMTSVSPENSGHSGVELLPLIKTADLVVFFSYVPLALVNYS